MHASRLVSILLLLQSRGRMTARELADELEVSLRTIYRDLDGLAEAGVPVYADRGPTGGYQLVDGYRTRLTGLSADEAEALFLSGLEGPAAQLGLGTVLAAAQLKMMAALPAELRARASRLRERFLLVAPRWFHHDESLDSLEAIANAVWEDERLRILYDGPDGLVERTVEPLGLVLKAGTWYLVARREGLMRTYRVSRIRDVRSLREPFERPEGFDLARHWAIASEAFEASLQRLRVTVRVRVDALDDLEYAVGAAAGVTATTGAMQATGDAPGSDALPEGHTARGVRDAPGNNDAPTGDGPGHATSSDDWVTVSFGTSSVETACADLLRLGGRAEVLAPPELRSLVAKTARALAEVYAGG